MRQEGLQEEESGGGVAPGFRAKSGFSWVLVTTESRHDPRHRPPVICPRPLRRLLSRARGGPVLPLRVLIQDIPSASLFRHRCHTRGQCEGEDMPSAKILHSQTEPAAQDPASPFLAVLGAGRGAAGCAVALWVRRTFVMLLPSSPASVPSRHPVGRTLAPEESPGTRVRLAREPPCGHGRFNSSC